MNEVIQCCSIDVFLFDSPVSWNQIDRPRRPAGSKMIRSCQLAWPQAKLTVCTLCELTINALRTLSDFPGSKLKFLFSPLRCCAASHSPCVVLPAPSAYKRMHPWKISQRSRVDHLVTLVHVISLKTAQLSKAQLSSSHISSARVYPRLAWNIIWKK